MITVDAVKAAQIDRRAMPQQVTNFQARALLLRHSGVLSAALTSWSSRKVNSRRAAELWHRCRGRSSAKGDCSMDAESPEFRTLEVRGWLLRAAEDLRAGRHDLTASPPLLNDVAFHAQQCAEKALD